MKLELADKNRALLPCSSPRNHVASRLAGWCIFEQFAAYIVVGTDSYKGQEEVLRLRPKLLDVLGGPVPELGIAPTPEEFAVRLQAATFTVEGDASLALEIYSRYWLANGVGGRRRERRVRCAPMRCLPRKVPERDAASL